MNGTGSTGLVIAACCKLVDRVEVDALSGAVRVEPNSAGMSPADEAALEWALRIAEAWNGSVVAVTAGPAQADQVLREAIAAGAVRAVRVDLDRRAASAAVAAGLALALRDAAVVCCGDASLDRGTGAVPAFLAGELGAEQALGLVGLHLPEPDEAGPPRLRAERRLDRGRREHLVVSLPCVVSVEAHTARLRRAPLDRVLASHDAAVELTTAQAPARLRAGSLAGALSGGDVEGHDASGGAAPVRTAPFRPRPRVVPAPASSLPARERVLSLLGGPAGRAPARTLHLPAVEAAAVLLETLDSWGELP